MNSAIRPLGGSAVVTVPCDSCGRPAVARYRDTGRVSASVSCAHCGMGWEIDGLALDGPQRAALLGQSGLWQLWVRVEPGGRVEAMAALGSVVFWTLDRLRAVPATGEVAAWEGTYGECHAAATRFEQLGIDIRLAHLSGDTAGLLPSAEASRFEEQWRRATRDADLTSRRCPHCDAPCPSYRRTCRVCLKPV